MGMYLIAAAIGVVTGILSGMLGIGGGSIMVPAFRLGFGLSAIQATATSLFAIIPTSIAGVVQHLRNGTCLVPLGLAAGLGGAVTSPLGVQLASMSPGWAIMLATGTVIAYTSLTMLRRGLAMPKDGAGGTAGSDPRVPVSGPGAAAPVSKLIGAGFAIGLVTGVAAGYIGLGGGFLMVPLFVVALHVPMKQASGTSLLAICILAIPGVARQMMLGNVAVGAGLALAVGTVPGALIGATLANRIPERTLRIFFGVFLIVVAVFLVVNEFMAAR